MTLFIGFVGHSGNGKTTLIEKLIGFFSQKGYKVGAIKHDAHQFEIDYPGKDSYRMKHAGARKVVLASSNRIAIIEDLDREIPLESLKGMFDGFDFVFVEGYKLGNLKKIEVHRRANGSEYLIRSGINGIVAVVCDEKIDTDVPVFELDDVEGIAKFIESLKE